MHTTSQHQRTQLLSRWTSPRLSLFICCILAVLSTQAIGVAGVDAARGSGGDTISTGKRPKVQLQAPSLSFQWAAVAAVGAAEERTDPASRAALDPQCAPLVPFDAVTLLYAASPALDPALAVCDNCRSICAKSCSSSACRSCDRSLRCGPFVSSCTLKKPTK